MKKSQLEEMPKKIEFLLKHYSMVRRTTTRPYILDLADKNIAGYTYHQNNEVVRESLTEKLAVKLRAGA